METSQRPARDAKRSVAILPFSRADQMHLKRGLIAGFCWGLVGLIGVAIGIGALTYDFADDLRFNLAWWRKYAFPGIVIVPMILFFAGVLTYTPTRHVGFAKNLVILVVTTLPLAVILGALGMAHPRYKSIDHPPMYISEVLMFLVPLTVVSFLLIIFRSGPLPERESSAEKSVPITANMTEPSYPPERPI